MVASQCSGGNYTAGLLEPDFRFKQMISLNVGGFTKATFSFDPNQQYL